MMNCGKCGGKHPTVALVRECYSGAITAGSAPASATDKQLSYLKVLLEDRDIEQLTGEVYERAFDLSTDAGKFVSKQEASDLIDALLKVEKVKGKKAAPVPELEDGIYIKDGEFFKVQHAIHGSGRQYAKKLEVIPSASGSKKVKVKWEYAGQAPLRNLTADDVLTAERAREFGRLYGVCVSCGLGLTNERSIYVGYGEICAGNHGWWYPKQSELEELMAVESGSLNIR